MKKTYMKPNMAIVNIQCRKMLTTSQMNLNSSTATEWGAHEMNDFDDFDE